MKEKAKKTKQILAEVEKKQQQITSQKRRQKLGRIALAITTFIGGLFLIMMLFTGFSLALILFILLWMWFLPFISKLVKQESFSLLMVFIYLVAASFISTILFMLTPQSEAEKAYLIADRLNQLEQHQKESLIEDGISLFLKELSSETELTLESIDQTELVWTTPGASLSLQRGKKATLINQEKDCYQLIKNYFSTDKWDHGPVGLNFSNKEDFNQIGWASTDTDGKYEGIMCIVNLPETTSPDNSSSVILSCGFGPGGDNERWK